jgi:hypothetical protein
MSKRKIFKKQNINGLYSIVDDTVPLPYQKKVEHTVSWMNFGGLVRYLEEEFGIEERSLYYSNDTPDESFAEPSEVHHYKALVNPKWDDRSELVPDDKADAVWHVPTTEYTPAGPKDLWNPLCKALEEVGLQRIFGQARLRRYGGDMHIDIFFEDKKMETPDDSDIYLGLSTGHDYFGTSRLYMNVIAYQTTGDKGYVIRDLSDQRRRKHTGDADEEFVEWYKQSVERLSEMDSKLRSLIATSMEYEVPIKNMPGTIEDFYKHLGLPSSKNDLCGPAADRAVETALGPYTGYHLYKAGMWAIDHFYPSADTKAFHNHVQTVNKLLYNPSRAEKEVWDSIEDGIKSRDEDIIDHVDDEEGLTDYMTARKENISEGEEFFESTRDMIDSILKDEGVAMDETIDSVKDLKPKDIIETRDGRYSVETIDYDADVLIGAMRFHSDDDEVVKKRFGIPSLNSKLKTNDVNVVKA